MGQKTEVASQMRKIEANQLIVSPNALYEHARSLFDPIARRAYEIFESRGCAHGNDWDDWYRAESELLHPVNIELSDSGDAILAVADVAGYRPEDLRVSVEPQALRICGLSSAQNEDSAKCEAELQRLAGFFVAFDLPAAVDTSHVSVGIKRDLLELRLPKASQQTKTAVTAGNTN